MVMVMVMDFYTRNGSTLLKSPPNDLLLLLFENILMMSVGPLLSTLKVKHVFLTLSRMVCFSNTVLAHGNTGPIQLWVLEAARANKIFVTCLFFNVVLTALLLFASVSRPPWNFDPRLLTQQSPKMFVRPIRFISNHLLNINGARPFPPGGRAHAVQIVSFSFCSCNPCTSCSSSSCSNWRWTFDEVSFWAAPAACHLPAKHPTDNDDRQLMTTMMIDMDREDHMMKTVAVFLTKLLYFCRVEDGALAVCK